MQEVTTVGNVVADNVEINSANDDVSSVLASTESLV